MPHFHRAQRLANLNNATTHPLIQGRYLDRDDTCLIVEEGTIQKYRPNRTLIGVDVHVHLGPLYGDVGILMRLTPVEVAHMG